MGVDWMCKHACTRQLLAGVLGGNVDSLQVGTDSAGLPGTCQSISFDLSIATSIAND
jgi:phosphopantetheinyl transferase